MHCHCFDLFVVSSTPVLGSFLTWRAPGLTAASCLIQVALLVMPFAFQDWSCPLHNFQALQINEFVGAIAALFSSSWRQLRTVRKLLSWGIQEMW